MLFPKLRAILASGGAVVLIFFEVSSVLHVTEGPQMTPMMIVIIILGAPPLGKRMRGVFHPIPQKMIV